MKLHSREFLEDLHESLKMGRPLTEPQLNLALMILIEELLNEAE